MTGTGQRHQRGVRADGSLTTPPYSESVTWLVLKDIHQAAPAQIERLNRLEGDNARHIQALSARRVEAE